MKFHRIYIELTNICGLSCSFCPTKELAAVTMDLSFFESIVQQARDYTNEIVCHVFGDPLTLSNLNDYLDVIHKHGLKAILTTSGYFIKKHSYDTLTHLAIKQINISLNAFNKNNTSISFEQYMEPIVQFCHKKAKDKKEFFINLRLWNLQGEESDQEFNDKLFDRFKTDFLLDANEDEKVYKQKDSIRLLYKVRLHFDSYFEWPSLNNKIYGHGTCHGLDSHIGVLASGKVVPCCLDSHGVMTLGDLHRNSLEDILHSDRAVSMKDGFVKSKCTEELCMRCSYKDRFN